MTEHDREPATTHQGSELPGTARGVAEEVRGAARDVVEETRAAAGTLKDEAGGLASTIKQGLASQAEQRKNLVADRLGQVASDLQQAAGALREREAWLAALIDRGSRELENVADDIKRNDVAGILGSAEVFARRQPALFMGAAVALGFALTRVVRTGALDEGRGTYRSPYGSAEAPRFGPGRSDQAQRDLADRYSSDRPSAASWPRAAESEAPFGSATSEIGRGPSMPQGNGERLQGSNL